MTWSNLSDSATLEHVNGWTMKKILQHLINKQAHGSNRRKVRAPFIGWSPINKNRDKKERRAQLQKTFRGPRVLTQRQYPKQYECLRSVMTFNAFKVDQHGEWITLRLFSVFTDASFCQLLWINGRSLGSENEKFLILARVTDRAQD